MTNGLSLKKLYEMQNEIVEHKQPRYDGNVSYFIEAAGDIYRECTKESPHFSYLYEKILKLEKFKGLTSGDLRELKEHHEMYPNFNKDFEEYLKNRVYRLWAATLAFNFKELEARRTRMLQALRVIREVSKWAMGQVSTNIVETAITNLHTMFGTKTDTPKDAFWR